VIAHPDGVFPLNHGQDILPAFITPAFLIFLCDVGNKIGQAAFAAAPTGVFRLILHCVQA
jgi:hypothetical protein